MPNLSATEIKVLNNLSKVRNPAVLLGTLLNSGLPHVGPPVNSVKASAVLNITGVVLDGQTVTFNNPLVPGVDRYEFLADEAQSKSLPSNIAVDITDYATKASVVLTVDTQPTAGDTMTIGSKTFLFVAVGMDDVNGEISVGANLGAAQANIVAAINGTDGHNTPHPLVSCGAFSSDDATITALVGGTAGNSITSIETFTAGTNVFATATLASGTNCSATNAVTALVAAITASDTQGVDAADGTGDTVDLTAANGGEAGNDIAISETLTNGAFAGAAVTLEDGVDGTLGFAGQVIADEDYLYVCLDDNSVSGENWVKAAITTEPL